MVGASKPVTSPGLTHTASISRPNQCKGNNWSVEVNMHLCLQGMHEVGLLRCPQTTTEVKNRLKTSQVFSPPPHPLQPVKSTACFRCEQHASKPAELSARTVSWSRKIQGLIMSIKGRYECQLQKHLWLTDNCIFLSLQGAHHRNGLIWEAEVQQVNAELGRRGAVA